MAVPAVGLPGDLVAARAGRMAVPVTAPRASCFGLRRGAAEAMIEGVAWRRER